MQKDFNPLELNSSPMLARVLFGVTLRDYQVRAMVHIAEKDSQLLAFDTGLGKTMTVVAGLVAKRNKGIKVRTLYLSPLRGLYQVRDTFRKHSKLRTSVLTGTSKGKPYLLRIDPDADVVLVNYEAFDNPEILEVILGLVQMGFFNCVVADEAHSFANIFTSNRNFFIASIIRHMEYKYFLTATPVVSKFQQYATLIALMRNDLNRLGHYLNRVKSGDFQYMNAPHDVQFKERKENYKVQLHLTPEVKVGRAMYGMEVFKYTRGPKVKPVEDKMKELILNGGEKLLIFSHLKSNHKYLKELAESLGRKVGIISGDTGDGDQARFNSGELDCIIYSVPTALNLPANNVILYDWTGLAHQAIGRGIRSTEVGDYTAHFILSQTEKELSLFNNSVLKSAVYLNDALGKAIEPILNLVPNK